MIFIFSYNLIKLLLKTQQELSTYKRVFVSALQEVVKRHSAASLPSVPSNNEKKGYGQIQLQKTESLFGLIGKIDPIQVVESENPSSMESVGQVFKNFSLVEFKISEPFFLTCMSLYSDVWISLIYISTYCTGPRRQFVHTKCRSCHSLPIKLGGGV